MKKILLSLLLAGGVQNSFVMGSCNGGEAAESGSRLEGQVPVKFSDGSVANLDLQRLRELNSGLLQGMLFTENGLSSIREGSTKDKHNLIVMQEFTNLEDFENFEKILKDELSGEIANMVEYSRISETYLKIWHSMLAKPSQAKPKPSQAQAKKASQAEPSPSQPSPSQAQRPSPSPQSPAPSPTREMRLHRLKDGPGSTCSTLHATVFPGSPRNS